MTDRVFRLALTAVLIAGAAASLAADLPAEAPRLWAPTGDLIGTANHAAATFSILDPYGDRAKLAEDDQLQETRSGSGLFYLHKAGGRGLSATSHGAATTADGEGLTGYLHSNGRIPGRLTYTAAIGSYNAFFDRDSELRAVGFGNPPAPPALSGTPGLEWQRADLHVGYRLSGAMALNASVRTIARKGSRGSLLRGATGNAVPNLKTYDGVNNIEASLGATYTVSTLAVDLTGTLRNQDGTRTLGTSHAWQDDRTAYLGRLGLKWEATPRTRLVGSAAVAKLENKGSETWQTDAVAPAARTTNSGGQLGLIQQLNRALTLRLSANFTSATTEGSVTTGANPLQSVDRDRTSQDYRIALTHAGLRATRLELAGRLRTSSRNEVLVDGTSFSSEQDQTASEISFKGRRRLSGAVLLKVQAGWSHLEREQTRDWTDPALKYWLGDYSRDEGAWRLVLQTRPSRLVRFDLGHEYIDRTFEDQSDDQVRTTFRANRGFANLNWTPRGWLTVYGTVSVGQERYLTGDGVAPAAGMGALNSDGTTWRWVPGVVAQVTDRLQCEAMYEGIRYEDKADAGAELGVLKSDHDRSLLRVAYRVGEEVTVSASYRRSEFFEQRWDNSISDLYGLTLSGRF